MSEPVKIIRRLAEQARGDLGADFRAGLSVGIAEAQRLAPGFLDDVARTNCSRSAISQPAPTEQPRPL